MRKEALRLIAVFVSLITSRAEQVVDQISLILRHVLTFIGLKGL